MYPGHPTQLSGKLVITGEIDGPSSSNIVMDTRLVNAVGVYIDDTTPNLAHWLGIAVQHYSLVLVAVAPRQIGKHWGPDPPVQNMYEAYSIGGPWPKNYEHLIVRWGYGHPSRLKRMRMLNKALKAVGGDADRVWLF